MKLPSNLEVYKCVGYPPRWQCCHKDLRWHCDPKEGIYREAKEGITREEAIKNMVEYIETLKINK